MKTILALAAATSLLAFGAPAFAQDAMTPGAAGVAGSATGSNTGSSYGWNNGWNNNGYGYNGGWNGGGWNNGGYGYYNGPVYRQDGALVEGRAAAPDYDAPVGPYNQY